MDAKYKQWTLEEEQFSKRKDKHYFNISFGYEFESNELSFSNDFQPVPASLRKSEITPIIDIYEDRLAKSNKDLLYDVRDFIDNLDKRTSYYELETSDYTVSLNVEILEEDQLFNDAEFIVTYAIPEKIHHDDFFSTFFDKFYTACKDLSKVFKSFHESNILNKDFPYKEIYKHSELPYYLLAYDKDIPIIKTHFTPQVTIGVDIQEAFDLLNIMYKFKDYIENFDVCVIYEKCRDLCNVVMKNYPRWKKMRDYLFLFFYSYLTRRCRREHIFLFRNIFSDLWLKYIGQVGRDVLYDLLQKFEKEINDSEVTSFLRYFEKVHYTKDSPRKRKYNQYLETSTVLDYDNRFFIEFRGLLELWLELSRTKKFTIHKFIHSKKLRQIFLSEFTN